MTRDAVASGDLLLLSPPLLMLALCKSEDAVAPSFRKSAGRRAPCACIMHGASVGFREARVGNEGIWRRKRGICAAVRDE